MEDFEQEAEAPAPQPEIPSPRLVITPQIRAYWQETANWALLFALLTIIYMVVSSIDTFSKIGASNSPEVVMPGIGIVVISIVVIVIVLTLVPVWFYYKFATLLKRGLQKESNNDIQSGFSFLKYHYVYYGVLAILYLAFFLLMFIFAIVMAANNNFR